MALTNFRKQAFFYLHLLPESWPTWKGRTFRKYGSDMTLYAEMIYETQPDYIIETGTFHGGSAMFFADMLEVLCGGGLVLSIDIRNRPAVNPWHHAVEFIRGSSTDPEVVRRVKNQVFNGSVMAVFDSDHSFEHVKDELETYKDIVTPGQFMVVEDCYVRGERTSGPYKAVNQFLEHSDNFKQERPEKKYIMSVTREGWLRRMH